MKLTVRAHAKINWSLAVCGERPNGYHNLDMLMQSIALSDELVLENARWLTLSVNGQRLPADSRNLVIRAANALNDALGLKLGARIQLKKSIPSRAGLGGGSADCAATLLALNQLWKLNLPLRTLMQIGLKLGADVPFCLQGGLCRAEGIGEILTPMADAPEVDLVMVTPGGGLSTPTVFQLWNAGDYPMNTIDNAALADALLQGDFSAAQRLSRNDLEAPAIALMPEISDIMNKFRQTGAKFVRMSGSGSTVFAVYGSAEEAHFAAEQVSGSIVTKTLGTPVLL